ncbi:MAG: hypothetical protein V4440_12975 [Pseudomonadota bacterium]
MKHADGHMLKIAHSKLSPKMLESLEKLPVHKMAEGGKVAKNTSPPEASTKNAQEMQKGATSPGTTISEALENIKQSLGIGKDKGGEVKQTNTDATRDPNSDHIQAYQMQEDAQQPPAKKPKKYADGGDTQDPQPDSAPQDAQGGQGPVNITINAPQAHPGSFGPQPPQNFQGPPAPPAAAAPQAPQQAPLDIQPMDPSSPEAASLAPQQASGAPQRSVQPQEKPSENTQLASPNGAEAAAEAPAVPQAPEQSTEAAQKQDEKQEILNQSSAFNQDLTDGHITPQTYSGMFAKKDTLGKIGMVFGMLLSGAGSGLSHQPNALLTLMQKEIDNDLAAQVQSKTNAQNFYKLNLQHQLQNTQIEQMVKQGKLTEAQAKDTMAQANTRAFALAQTQMLLSSYHKLVSDTNKLPAGSPERANAEQTLGMMYSKIGERINDISDLASSASAYNKLLFGNPLEQNKSPEQAFQQRSQGMRMLGPQGEARAKDIEEKHFPGLSGQASVPLNGSDREALNSGITFDNQLRRFMNWTAGHSGDISPTDRKTGQALAAELQGAYRQATHGGIYKEGEANFINKFIDQEPTKFFNSIRVLPSLKALADNSQERLSQLAKSKGFEGYTPPQGKEQSTQQLTPQQQSFLDYAKAHPENPNSANVIKKLGNR